MADSVADLDKWWEHPHFWYRYFDTISSSEADEIIKRFWRQSQNKEKVPPILAYAFFAAWLDRYVKRTEAEKAGTFQLKPPIPDDELPPSLQKPIPCALGCGREFHRTDFKGAKVTSNGVEPAWSPWSVCHTDEDGIPREYARVRCWDCDDVCYPRLWVEEQIRAAAANDPRSAAEEWLRLWHEEHERAEVYAEQQAMLKAKREAREQEIAETTTAKVILGRIVSTGQPVDVTAEDLCSGTYLLGTQGAGKSSLLEQIAYQRMAQHDSVIVLDPHGELIDNIIARIPEARLRDTYLLDLSDARRYPFHLNIFHCTDPRDEAEHARTRGRVLRVFRRIWPEIEAGQYVEKMLRYVTTTLIYNPGCTLADVPDLFRSPEAVSKALVNVQDPETRAFWTHDLPSLSPRDRSFQTEPFLNRVVRLLSDDLLRRLLCNPGPPLNFGQLIRQRRSLLIKLPVAADVIGEAANLTGIALFSLIYASTFDDRPKDHRDSYTLIVDEFQNFVTSEFVRLFVGGRKYGAKLALAHQYTNQLDLPGLEMNRRGVLTARTIVSFHTTPHDAVEVAPLYAQLEKTWARDNLVADVAEALERHSVEAVKKFALRHIDPLIQGSRMQDTGGYRPSLDFGWGNKRFNPEAARYALAQLNDLLYEAERNGRVSDSRRAVVVQAMTDVPEYFHYEEDAAEMQHQLDRDLCTVLSALIADPLVEYQPAGGRTVATQLPSLPSRTAFVKTGSQAYHMETYPLPQAVDQDEFEEREEILFRQTHQEYCSPKATVDEQIRNSPCRREPRDEVQQQEKEDPPQAGEQAKPPSIRRRSPKRK